LINLGIGGRNSNPHDGVILGKIDCDQLVVLMGVNDWQGGRPVTRYKQNMQQFIANFRKLQPETAVCLVTPLWVPQTWQPKSAKADLEAYRQALREVAQECADPNLTLLEGPALIDHDKKYFDRVAVHPNESGFEMMAQRLAKLIVVKSPSVAK
jgi:lysophospholipase L1-like esterase